MVMSNPISITKDDSKIIKGVAVLLMVAYHYGVIAASVGVACVGMFAFVTGFSHSYHLNGSPHTRASSIRLFLPFFERFIVLIAFVYVAIYITNPERISFSDVLWSVSSLKPNVVFDSWWYAFAFACYCFVLFPIIKLINILQKYSQFLFLFVLFCLSLICLSLPILFQKMGVHPAFGTVCGDIPCLRTIMFVPYYVVGYTLCISHYKKTNAAYITCICIIVMCICWPFRLYKIALMDALNVAAPFVAFTLLSLGVSGISKIAVVLKWFGSISTFLWLLHMPVLFYIKKFCSFHYIAIIPSFFVSVLLAWLFHYLYARLNLIRFYRRKASENH